MVTKSNGWTARRPVKIISFILIPVMVFLALTGLVSIGIADFYSNNNNIDVLFADFTYNNYFFDRFIPNTLTQSQILFELQSEDHIRGMGCLEWRISKDHNQWRGGYDDDLDEKYIDGNWYVLTSKGDEVNWYIGPVHESELGGDEAKALEEEAIRMQLQSYSNAKKLLEETPGLLFLVTDGERALGNTPDGAMET